MKNIITIGREYGSGGYEIGEKVYFGEMTFYHYSGFTSINPEEWDEKLGSYIILPKKNSKDDER